MQHTNSQVISRVELRQFNDANKFGYKYINNTHNHSLLASTCCTQATHSSKCRAHSSTHTSNSGIHRGHTPKQTQRSTHRSRCERHTHSSNSSAPRQHTAANAGRTKHTKVAQQHTHMSGTHTIETVAYPGNTQQQMQGAQSTQKSHSNTHTTSHTAEDTGVIIPNNHSAAHTGHA